MRLSSFAAGAAAAGLVSAALVAPWSAAAPTVPTATSAKSVIAVKAALPALSRLKVTFARRSGAFAAPTQVTNAADGSGRLFVVEKRGVVRVYQGKGKIQAKPYLDIRSRVRDSGEQGLLGIAFRGDFAANPRFWVAYVARNGSLQVSRFSPRSARSATTSAATERKVLNVPHPGSTNHNGGSLAFGKDGLLYIGTGDGGGSGDPRDNAQNRSRLLGKILRVDVTRSCGGKAYCNPASNPYAGSEPGRAEVWAIGLRNPWRTSIDAKDGSLWIGDVGQNRYEEIDRIPAGRGGHNLGWPCREGTSVYSASRCRSGAAYRNPVEQYGRALGSSVTGGFVYRGRAYKKLIAGRYVYADFGSGRVWLRGAGGATRRVATLGQVSSFGVNGAGEIYAVTLEGGLYAMKVARR